MHIEYADVYTTVSLDDGSLILNIPKDGIIQLAWSTNSPKYQRPTFRPMELTDANDQYADNASCREEAILYLESKNFVALEKLMVDFYNNVIARLGYVPDPI